MIEAFEIGVSLALQDGVSESILSVQQNIAALQAAIASSGVSIQALREAGSRAASISGGEPDPTPLQRSDTQDAEKTPLNPAPSTSASLPVDTAQEKPGTNPSLIEAAHQDREGNPGVWDSPRSRDNGRSDAEPARDLTSAVAAQASASPMDTARPGIPLAPSGVVETGLAAAVMSPGAERASASAPPGYTADPFGAPVAPGAEAISGLDQLAFQGNAGGAAPGLQDRPSLATVLVQNDGHTGQPGSMRSDGFRPRMPVGPYTDRRESLEDAAIDWPSVAPGGDEAARRNPDMMLHTTLSSVAPRPMTAQESSAPQGQQRQDEPFRGDVFLDGMLVGRWVSKFLRREAERAESGPTGFDAKRSRLLPGVTVGG